MNENTYHYFDFNILKNMLNVPKKCLINTSLFPKMHTDTIGLNITNPVLLYDKWYVNNKRSDHSFCFLFMWDHKNNDKGFYYVYDTYCSSFHIKRYALWVQPVDMFLNHCDVASLNELNFFDNNCINGKFFEFLKTYENTITIYDERECFERSVYDSN